VQGFHALRESFSIIGCRPRARILAPFPEKVDCNQGNRKGKKTMWHLRKTFLDGNIQIIESRSADD